MTMRSKLILLLALAALLFGSCTNPFHPNLRDDGQTAAVNSSPTSLLRALELSYRQKNIQLFKQCLDKESFRFELLSSEVNSIGIDWNEDGIKDSWWGYEQEVEYHQNLFEYGSSDGSYPSPDQINLRLQIPPQEQWLADPEVGHEDWICIPCLFDLQLMFPGSSSSLSSSGVARFFLKPAGNLWYIAVWRDESNI